MGRPKTEQLTADEVAAVRRVGAELGMRGAADAFGVSIETMRRITAGIEGIHQLTVRAVRERLAQLAPAPRSLRSVR